ncbi:AraC family transcriptional regulator [uncultured Litoreibacter sp.]|uniref:AraC family transcriptional regulator n=1 Tax=uncultured Litoreibacter sp. TaxID=1392394 RepID=UPI00262476BF|nr:AraC family transcriptional regulator [uncultured Litoreibacter sp.]
MTDDILKLLDLIRVRGTACVGETLTAPWYFCHPSSEGFARFHLVLSGQTWLQIDGMPEPSLLLAGDIVIIPNGKAHCYFSDENADGAMNAHLFCGYFQFTENTPKAITSRLPDMLIERSGTDGRAHKLDLIFQLINAEVSKTSAPQQSVLNRLTEILCLHTVHDWLQSALSHDETLQALANPRIKGVLEEIHSNPSAAWTVDSLADIYGQSRTAFAERFKLATGLSPIHYVRQCRMGQACKMLESTTLLVDEIAYKTGYADANAFNRAFRRETGASPSAYRRAPRA